MLTVSWRRKLLTIETPDRPLLSSVSTTVSIARFDIKRCDLGYQRDPIFKIVISRIV